MGENYITGRAVFSDYINLSRGPADNKEATRASVPKELPETK